MFRNITVNGLRENGKKQCILGKKIQTATESTKQAWNFVENKSLEEIRALFYKKCSKQKTFQPAKPNAFKRFFRVQSTL